MRRLTSLTLLVAVVAACRTRGVQGTAPQHVLAGLEARLAALIDAGDTAGLDALLAPEFALVGQDTTRQVARATWIANTARLSFDSVRATLGDVAVNGDSAVVGLQLRFAISGAGVPPASERYDLADTWVRRGATWRLARRRLLARQTTPR